MSPQAPTPNTVASLSGGGAAPQQPYTTQLSPGDEAKFQAWVKAKQVPWQDEPRADYDMRGFWKGLTTGDQRASQALSQFDGRMHFPDTWKTPYHRTISNESMYAPADAPHWEGDRLIDKNGRVVADETPPPAPSSPSAPVPYAQPPGFQPQSLGLLSYIVKRLRGQ